MSARRFRATLVAAAAVAATLVTAAPAEARDPVEWNMAPCATALLSEAGWDREARMFVVNGVAIQCEPVVLSGGVRIATYKPDTANGSAPGYNVRLFPDATPGAIRTFGVAAVPPTAGEYGVCVLAGDQQRIACAAVTVLPPSGNRPLATTLPISTDAPLVDKPVVTGPYTGALAPPSKGGPGGTCGTCF